MRNYWKGRLSRGLGEARELGGDAAGALEARRRSLDAWDRFLVQRLDPDETAEAELERGKLLYTVGERDRGLAALQRAIDANPERSSTYADVLAFLVPRGELDEALDAYHRALGRPPISEYIKVYTSMWIVDLGQRVHAPEDPLAHDFLGGVRGERWHQDLARWASAKASTESDTALSTRADTAGKRCELDFYLAMRSLRSGLRDEARSGWQKVIASGMMAFFEYDMARYYLLHEPGAKAAEPSK